jgi:hypothetical protein
MGATAIFGLAANFTIAIACGYHMSGFNFAPLTNSNSRRNRGSIALYLRKKFVYTANTGCVAPRRAPIITAMHWSGMCASIQSSTTYPFRLRMHAASAVVMVMAPFTASPLRSQASDLLRSAMMAARAQSKVAASGVMLDGRIPVPISL